MMELGITRTPLGVLTISAAAVDDAIGWILLATVSAAVNGSFSPDVLTIASRCRSTGRRRWPDKLGVVVPAARLPAGQR